MRLDAALERQLARVQAQWRQRRLLGQLAVLGIVLCLAYLAIGLALWKRLLGGVWGYFALGAPLLVAIPAFLVIAVAALAMSRPRSWLAGRLEQLHSPLQDRLNTLVFLEGRRGHPAVRPLFRRIEAQAREAVAHDAPALPRATPAVTRLLWAFLALLLLDAWFYARYPVMAGLDLEQAMFGPDPAGSELQVRLPEPDAAEVKKAWGEVRITEPGRDLKVTKVDVVPLQIEAASSDALGPAQWFTTTLAEPRAAHALPPPPEPHYAVYKPTLYLDELRLSDWDVLSYYASTKTGSGKSYASDIYFIEVRPFREDILKLPGGEGGKAYQALNELTGLIDRQKHVLRETHGFVSRAYDKDDLKRQDQAKLEGAESDLQQAANHLYAKIAGTMEHQDVAVVLDQLAQAEAHLGASVEALQKNPSFAPPPEQDALAALVATRKKLQKAISDNPGAFGDSAGAMDDEASPVADLPDKLKEISEFRDEEKAAKDLLKRSTAEQRKITDAEPGAKTAEARGSLADRERALREGLDGFAQAHPRLFKDAQAETKGALAALEKAAKALDGPPGAGTEARQAQGALEDLARAVDRKSTGRQLADAYRLKEMLDAQAKALSGLEKNPAATTAAQGAEDAAAAGTQTTRALRKVVDETDAGEAFDTPLRDALSEGRQAERERLLDALAKAEDPAARGKAAGRSRESLEGLSRDFERSEPPVVKALKADDALGGSGDEALERGLRALESLGGERAGALSAEEQEKQRREALEQLRKGAVAIYGRNEGTDRLLLRVESELDKVDLKVDGPRLRKLVDAIEQFRLEMSEKRLAARPEQELKHVDPGQLPPAYRERIQRYFEKLSEDRP